MGSNLDKIRKQQLWKEKNLASTNIPPKVALNEKLKDYCEENYRLNFEYYNHNCCELCKVQRFKPLIEGLKIITRSNRDTIKIRDTIENSGDYKNLFIGLPPDADLEEIDFSEVGRITFFRIDKYFCLVTILAKHRRKK